MLSPKNDGSKNFRLKISWVENKCIKKFVGPKEMWLKKTVVKKTNNLEPKFFGTTNFSLKYIWL